MKIEQNIWVESAGWKEASKTGLGATDHLVLLFGSTTILNQKPHLEEIKTPYPQAHLLGCSTAGEICGTQVYDHSLGTIAVPFEHSTIECAQ